MPALVNLPPSLFLSDTDPPFIYQYVGDQIKIIQILGSNSPLTTSFNNETNNPDQWDQKEATFEDASPIIESIDSRHDNSKNHNDNLTKNETDSSTKVIEKNESSGVFENITDEIKNDKIDHTAEIKPSDNKNESKEAILQSHKLTPNIPENDSKDNIIFNTDDSNVDEGESDKKATVVEIAKVEDLNIPKPDGIPLDDFIDTTSLETSANENYSAESDDEASFGTPENSPKSKRKSPYKGKYGKSKAPPPPKVETEIFINEKLVVDEEIQDNPLNTSSHESLVDIVNKMPNTAFKDTGSKSLRVVNPIAEKKMRHKSNSPARLLKGNTSGIGKLLQLPSKLAFWKNSDDKMKDNMSTSSTDGSRRSSTIEKTIDEFQSCNELNAIASADLNKQDDDQISFKDAADFDNEIISHDIMEKSDALQKLIEAKLESHPEYKIVSLHEEIPTTSKSTDV